MNKTCKDCIKHDVCEWYGYVDVQTYSPENCMFFKSKDEYVKVAQDQNKPTRSEQRRINVQQGKPVNEGLEPVISSKDELMDLIDQNCDHIFEQMYDTKYDNRCGQITKE